MPPSIQKSFPWVLKRAWQACDPATTCKHYCDASGSMTVHRKLQTLRGDYWICSETGQMVRDQFPAQSTEIYDQWWQRRLAELSAVTPDGRSSHQQRISELEPYRRTGRLLEIGSGLGEFLTAAVRAGWKAQGNELSPVAARHAEKTAGADVFVGPIEQVSLERGVYDVVLCDNVFEHLTQPMATLKKLADSLRPGGVIFFQTLSAQSLSLWLQPQGWNYFGDTHLHVPTLVSLRLYFTAANLKPIQLQTHGCRSSARDKYAHRSRVHRTVDKLLSSLAGRTNLGHRVSCLLVKNG